MPGRALSVLIVDDDTRLGSALTRDLRRHGVVAEHVVDIAHAEKKLSEGEVDVLLADLQLGTEDGMRLLARARSLSERTRTILMSGYALEEERVRATELGAKYLEKPFTPGQFFQLIEQVTQVEVRPGGGNLLQTLTGLHRAKKTATVVVFGPVRGEVAVVDGEVVHASRGSLIGADALRDLLAIPHRRLEVRSSIGSPRSISAPFEPLIFAALEQLDGRERPINR